MRGLLLKPTQNACASYKAIWNGYRKPDVDVRWLFYRLWEKYWTFADSHFVTQFQIDLEARFWEMYLTVFISESHEVKSASHGPDIEIIRDGKSFAWVEAVTATPGAAGHPDSVPKMDFSREEAAAAPEDKIIMRLTSALKTKVDKHERYVRDGVVKTSEPFVVAINGAPIKWMGDPYNERILKALFPIGDEYLVFDENYGKLSRSQFSYRNFIEKNNGSRVFVDSFLNPENEMVSGVIYSSKNFSNLPKNHGEEMVFVHNPFAKNPLDYGLFKVGEEYRCSITGDKALILSVNQEVDEN